MPPEMDDMADAAGEAAADAYQIALDSGAMPLKSCTRPQLMLQQQL